MLILNMKADAYFASRVHVTVLEIKQTKHTLAKFSQTLIYFIHFFLILILVSCY